jgi:hypothetical protein
MELTEEMIEEIRQAGRLVEFGKVIIEIDTKGNEPSLDIITTARRRFQKSMPTPGNVETSALPGRRPV